MSESNHSKRARYAWYKTPVQTEVHNVGSSGVVHTGPAAAVPSQPVLPVCAALQATRSSDVHGTVRNTGSVDDQVQSDNGCGWSLGTPPTDAPQGGLLQLLYSIDDADTMQPQAAHETNPVDNCDTFSLGPPPTQVPQGGLLQLLYSLDDNDPIVQQIQVPNQDTADPLSLGDAPTDAPQGGLLQLLYSLDVSQTVHPLQGQGAQVVQCVPGQHTGVCTPAVDQSLHHIAQIHSQFDAPQDASGQQVTSAVMQGTTSVQHAAYNPTTVVQLSHPSNSQLTHDSVWDLLVQQTASQLGAINHGGNQLSLDGAGDTQVSHGESDDFYQGQSADAQAENGPQDLTQQHEVPNPNPVVAAAFNVHGAPLTGSPFSVTCNHCGAMLLPTEHARTSQSICCNGGRNKLQNLPVYTIQQKQLYKSRGFGKISRIINNLFNFTALGSQSRNGSTGFQYFTSAHFLKLHGSIYHRALPLNLNNPFQWLILDPENTAYNDLDPVQKSWCERVKQLIVDFNPFYPQLLVQEEFAPNQNVSDGQIVTRFEHETVEIAAVYRDDCGIESPPLRSVQLFRRNGTNNDGIFVRLTSPFYETLQYPLIYLQGELGWFKRIFGGTAVGSNDGHANEPAQQVLHSINSTSLQGHQYLTAVAYCKQMILRCEQLHDCCRLFQQWLCDMFSRIEEERLNFIRFNLNQRIARATEISNDETIQGEGGVRPGVVYLPASFPGSIRASRILTLDGLRIVSYFGKPSYFITITCNPAWPEFKAALPNGQSVFDRPDICCRVFKKKLYELLKILRDGVPFQNGRPQPARHQYYMCVVEFQKRGLPHAHIAVRYAGEQPDNAAFIDGVVKAEMPRGTSQYAQQLRQVVSRFMMHRHNSRCKVEGSNRCSYFYPKPIRATTEIDNKGYVQHRKREQEDRNVVAYNEQLSMRFRCHINVEVAATVNIMAYLYKYIYKGSDQLQYAIQQQDGNVDEIANYIKARYVSSTEAVWRLMGYDVNRRNPAVQALPVHMPGQQSIVFDNLTEAQQAASTYRSKLMKYFLRPVVAGHLTYMDFYSHYYEPQPNITIRVIAGQSGTRWKGRLEPIVTRINVLTPRAGELYYLRLLLKHLPCCEFAHLKVHNGTTYDSFKEAAVASGLVVDDNENFLCMQESIDNLVSPYKLRSLFVMLLQNGGEGLLLFNGFKWHMGKDIHMNLGGEGTDEQLSTEADNNLRVELESRLSQHSMSLADFDIQMPINPATELNRAQLQLQIDHVQNVAYVQEWLPRLTNEQVQIYNLCVYRVQSQNSLCLFIDAPAGCGKTLVLKTIASQLRSDNHVVLMCASTGIAAQAYENGMTAHSLFKIPIKEDLQSNQNSDPLVCSVGGSTQRAHMIREASMIVWDEIATIHRRNLAAVDALLRDLCDQPHVPFGGKVFVIAGDFRQTGPVVASGSYVDVVGASVKGSLTFESFERMQLTQVMRSQGDEQWTNGTMDLGNGTQQPPGQLTYTTAFPQGVRTFNNPNDAMLWVQHGDHVIQDPTIGHGAADANVDDTSAQQLPTAGQTVHQHTASNGQDAAMAGESHPAQQSTATIPMGTQAHVPSVMEHGGGGVQHPTAVTDAPAVLPHLCALLAFTNAGVDGLNQLALNQVPGEVVRQYSNDVCLEDTNALPLEFIEQCSPKGIPPHLLELKVGALCILTRNLSARDGLLNGTKVQITDITPRIISVQQYESGETFPIPRIKFNFTATNTQFSCQRVQFPIRLAYAITVNKSQGQTLERVCLDLRSQAFSHGQLYVACSRVKNMSSFSVLVDLQQQVAFFQQQQGSMLDNANDPAQEGMAMPPTYDALVRAYNVVYPQLLV